MSAAKLNIWVRDQRDPCKVDMRFVWLVDVFTCDGRPLEWCGTRYYGAHKTRHGHREIEVPPGCYVVRARTGSHENHNLFTHRAMVVACCDDDVCVNLFTPGLWRCGHEFSQALEFQAEVGNVPREIALRALEANREVLEALPRDIFGVEPEVVKEMLERGPQEEEEGEDEEQGGETKERRKK